VIKRKKNLLTAQLILFALGILIIFFTYYNREQTSQIITLENKKKIDNTLTTQDENDGDIFYNIQYSGIDLSGNRYILNAKEAINNNTDPELVAMKFVEVNFYFKDDTVLNVLSDKGVYNNITLDMLFENNVRAYYEGSELIADKANFSNLNSYLEVSENVTVTDKRGVVAADKLLFDIKKQQLDIISFNNNKINAKIDVK
tara:strand:- start:530 stop:1132 length:603 start_codon:yes stop_codon:yes gene_type:complete